MLHTSQDAYFGESKSGDLNQCVTSVKCHDTKGLFYKKIIFELDYALAIFLSFTPQVKAFHCSAIYKLYFENLLEVI